FCTHIPPFLIFLIHRLLSYFFFLILHFSLNFAKSSAEHFPGTWIQDWAVLTVSVPPLLRLKTIRYVCAYICISLCKNKCSTSASIQVHLKKSV
uniref:Uncharacterized protein n=1 Tax=Anser brachyrhynchus TaxID=132585 RepID=A0A8B9B9T3_9AVES